MAGVLETLVGSLDDASSAAGGTRVQPPLRESESARFRLWRASIFSRISGEPHGAIGEAASSRVERPRVQQLFGLFVFGFTDAGQFQITLEPASNSSLLRAGMRGRYGKCCAKLLFQRRPGCAFSSRTCRWVGFRQTREPDPTRPATRLDFTGSIDRRFDLLRTRQLLLSAEQLGFQIGRMSQGVVLPRRALLATSVSSCVTRSRS